MIELDISKPAYGMTIFEESEWLMENWFGGKKADELRVQRYLRTGSRTGGNVLEGLERQYGIIHKRHGRYPNLVLFKYNQISSPFAEQIVRECRGIILDESDNWNAVSMAFTKFFNYGEGHAAEIDWSTARVQEKLDGSLCVLYWYNGEWHVATSGTPDASGEVHSAGGTFAQYFWATFENEEWNLPVDETAKQYCFFFELTGPDNRVVVVHDRSELTLLGGRYLPTLQERPVEECARLFPDWRTVDEFPLTSFEDIAKSFETMSPLSQEGYVVVDAKFNRVKVKHPGYVALHHAKDGMTKKAFLEIVRSGETSEVLTAFPEFKPMFDEIKGKYDALLADVEREYAEIADIPVQKDFALKAVLTRCPGALFTVRAKKANSFREYFKDMRLENLADLLKLNDAA